MPLENRRPFANRSSNNLWAVGNEGFELAFLLGSDGLLRISGIISRTGSEQDWTPSSPAPFGPVLLIEGEPSELFFEGIDIGGDGPDLTLTYRSPVGLQVSHVIRPSSRTAAFRTWTTLTNDSNHDIEEISRFDALNLGLGVTDAEPLATYLTGWLGGPRIDAPGRPPAAFAYGSWISPLLYGEDAQTTAPGPSRGLARV